LNVQLEVFPAWSVAVHVSVVVPLGKAEPDGVVHSTLAEQLSDAVAWKATVAVHFPRSTGAVMLAGQLIMGGVVS
jgi:hypothetical protein